METLPLVLPVSGTTQCDSSNSAGRSARRGPATTERRPRQSVTTVELAPVWPAHHHHRCFRATWCPRRGHGCLLGFAAVSIGKVLIANRGEIAVRVARTCREMGIRSVAVYSDADRAALHLRCCDEAVRVGPAASRESYLVIDSVIAACKATRADSVHPGYGFLSENAAFARACATAGILFIGPPPEAIEEMGEKTRARRKVIEAGVPVVPGLKEPIPEGGEAKAKEFALSIGYPIMLKAAAGGGGKGMRLVAGPKDFDAALATAQREALGAFGDARVYIEKAVARPRHVEIQVFADTHGNCIWLGERECSVQRRHQKVIEETPSPVLTPELRAGMGRVAVNAARTREEAIARLRRALRETVVKGITTNTAYLGRVLDLEEFRKGDYDTGLLTRAQDRLLGKEKTGDEEIALAAAAIWQCEQDQRAALRQAAANASGESAWGRAGRLASLRRSR